MLDRGLLNILALALLLGPSFLCNKIALVELGPLTIVSLRLALGVLFIGLLLKYQQVSLRVSKRFWAHSFVLGFFANSFPFVCFCYSLFYIPTSLSALVNGMMPVFTIILARFFLQERLTWNKIVGIALGLLGFCILFIPSLLQKNSAFSPLGMSLSLMGSASYAIAAIYGRKYVTHVNPLLMSFHQLSSCLLYMIPVAFVFESPWPALHAASVSTWGALFGVAFLGTTLAIIVYYRILLRQGVAAVSIFTYLLPVITTIIGVLFLKERIHSDFIIAATSILVGIVLVNKKVQT